MKVITIVVTIVVLLLLFFIGEMKQLVVKRYEIVHPDIPDNFHGLHIVHMSDLHGNCFGKKQERLREKIREENPDIIMITGDMVNFYDDKKVDDFIELLGWLSREYTVVYEPGNHEICSIDRKDEERGEGYGSFVEKVKGTGAIYLDNAVFCWKPENSQTDQKGLFIYGLALEKMYFGKLWNYVEPDAGHMEELIGPAKEDGFNILLAHHPDYLEVYEEWGADLVLSGHIHGGIARLPLIGGVLSPVMRLFPRYDGGVYMGKNHRTQMVLSRGLGSHTIPLRPFNPPELVVVTLKSENAGDGSHV